MLILNNNGFVYLIDVRFESDIYCHLNSIKKRFELCIKYFFGRYWALAIPTYAMVMVVLAVVFYIAMNFMITPLPTSFNTIFGKFER